MGFINYFVCIVAGLNIVGNSLELLGSLSNIVIMTNLEHEVSSLKKKKKRKKLFKVFKVKVKTNKLPVFCRLSKSLFFFLFRNLILSNTKLHISFVCKALLSSNYWRGSFGKYQSPCGISWIIKRIIISFSVAFAHNQLYCQLTN